MGFYIVGVKGEGMLQMQDSGIYITLGKGDDGQVIVGWRVIGLERQGVLVGGKGGIQLPCSFNTKPRLL